METNLEQAYLRHANLHGAFFREAELGQAILDDADLREAQDLTTQQIQSAENWRLAYYSSAFRAELGLPPEDPTAAGPRSDQP